MHNNFIDKNRRNLNLRDVHIADVLPEHFSESYPKFISILERYYEWQNQNDSTELLNHLFAARDITETDLTLLSFIEDELLIGASYFEGFPDKRAAASFSSVLFRAKGSKYSIEWFFRSFFQLDPEVIYPKENVFLLAQDGVEETFKSKIGPYSLRYMTNDKLYQTFAILVRAGIQVSEWRDLFKLFVHPAGMYLGGEVLLQGVAKLNLKTKASGYHVQRPSPIMNIAADYEAVNEGITITYTVTGTNVFGGTYYWYVDHGTTEDGDFVLGSNIPSLASPYELDIVVTGTDNFGTISGGNVFSLTIANDFDDRTEYDAGLDETFNIRLLDWCDSPVRLERANKLTTIQNVHYIVTAGDVDETNLDTLFTVSGTNLPDGDIKWYLDYMDTDANDYVDQPPLVANPSTITVSSGTATFNIKTKRDYMTEGTEQFGIHLLGPGRPVGSSVVEEVELLGYESNDRTVFDMNDTSVYPQYSITANNITEGEDITFSLTIINGTEAIPAAAGGDDITFSVTSSDGRVTLVTSQALNVTAENIGTPFTAAGTSTTDTYDAPATATVSFIANGNSDNVQIDINDLAPSYSISPLNVTVGEQSTIEFDFINTNVPPGNLYWWVDSDDLTVDDYAGGVLPPDTGNRGVLDVTSNGTRALLTGTSNKATVSTIVDLIQETDDQYTIKLSETPTGPVVAQSTITLDDTLPDYTVTLDASSYVEGNPITGTITSTIYYPASPDIVTLTISGDASSDVRITGSTNAGTVQVSMASGSETFSISSDFSALVEGDVSGQIDASSVLDTVIPSVLFDLIDDVPTYVSGVLTTNPVTDPLSIDENEIDTATYTVNTTNVVGGTQVAYTLAGTNILSADINIPLTGFVTIDGNTQSGSIFFTATKDFTTEPAPDPEVLTISLATTDGVGTSLAIPDVDLLIQDTSKTRFYEVTILNNPTSWVEGQENLSFRITPFNFENYEDVDWNINDGSGLVETSDLRFQERSGTILAASFQALGYYDVTVVQTAATRFDGDLIFNVSASGLVGNTGQASFTILDGPVVRSLTIRNGTTLSVTNEFDEGDIIRVNYSVQNEDNTTVYIEFENNVQNDVAASDFVNNSWNYGTSAPVDNPQPIGVPGNPDSFQYEIQIRLDYVSDNVEDFVIKIWDTVNRDNLLAVSNTITINDTSNTPTFAIDTSGQLSLSQPSSAVVEYNVGTFDATDDTGLNVNSLDIVNIRTVATNGPPAGLNVTSTANSNILSAFSNTPGWGGSSGYRVNGFDSQADGATWATLVSDSQVGQTEVHSGTITVVGEYTYPVTTVGLPLGVTTVYWVAGNGSDAGDWVTGSTAAYTATSNLDELRGSVDITTDGNGDGTGNIVIRITESSGGVSGRDFDIRIFLDSGYTDGPKEISDTISLLGGATVPVVTLLDRTFVSGATPNETSEVAGMTFSTNGVWGEYATTEDATPAYATGVNSVEWLNYDARIENGGTVNGFDYQIRLSGGTGDLLTWQISGTTDDGVYSYGEWVGMNGNNSWYVLASDTNGETVSRTGITVEISTWDGTAGNLGFGVQQDTATVSMTATNLAASTVNATMDIYPMFSTNEYTFFARNSVFNSGNPTAARSEAMFMVEETGGSIIVKLAIAGQAAGVALGRGGYEVNTSTTGSTLDYVSTSGDPAADAESAEIFRIDSLPVTGWSVRYEADNINTFGAGTDLAGANALDTADASGTGSTNISYVSNHTQVASFYDQMTTSAQLITGGVRGQKAHYFGVSALANAGLSLASGAIGSYRLIFSRSGQTDISVDIICDIGAVADGS